ncbi:hypothetical protein INT43_002542 [Umbelopsis isabellina]|uniref:Tubulin-specific chaperone D n=1 Tax=Mortierella isabellina TaxID=91625 RepID=A0A8H7Q420_MORIS|nr:hypothetical protein INT43_002542 [Umbelopsis isabellina]
MSTLHSPANPVMMATEIIEDEDAGVEILQQLSHFEHAAEALALLDTYQEQPHLLDPHLESMITPAVERIRTCVSKDSAIETQNKCIYLFQYLYYLTKTRGYKTIVKFMTHEVADLEPMVDFIESQDIANSIYWEERYVSLIWLSIICMVPFDLRKIDSSLVASGQRSLISRLLDVHKKYLGSTGKERDASSILVARLLSRRDVAADHLIPYLKWAKYELSNSEDIFMITGLLSSLCAIFQYAARDILFQALDDVAFPILSLGFKDKFSSNSVVRKLYIKLAERISLCYLKPRVAHWRYQRGEYDLVWLYTVYTQKLNDIPILGNRSLAKNLDTTTLMTANTISQPHRGDKQEEEEEDYDDIPEEIETVIDILLTGLRDKDTIVRWSAAKGVGRICQRLPREFADEVVGSLLDLFSENVLRGADDKLDISATSEHTWHGVCLSIAELSRRGLLLPSRLNETVDWVIIALKFDIKRGSHSIGSNVRDAACYVCWSFARAYAPEVIQQYVIQIAHTLVSVSVYDREINVRRAASAAFQENVGRQGVFAHGIDIIQTANYFSLGNRNHSFLYVSLEIAQFEEYRSHLIDHLLQISIRHWDKQMRVLASQTLGKLVPVDPQMFLSIVLPRLVPDATSTDQNISHGALLSVAEITLALSTSHSNVSDSKEFWKTTANELSQQIVAIIGNIPTKNLTTFGSEKIREAACHLIACLAEAGVFVSEEDSKCLKQLIASSLKRKEESVQQFAVSAFGTMARYNGFDADTVKDCHLEVISSRHLYGRRGYALALGAIPFNLPVNYTYLPDVLSALCSTMTIKVIDGSIFAICGIMIVRLMLIIASLVYPKQQDSPQENDAETKRNAIISIQNIIKQLGDQIKTAIPKEIFQSLLCGLLKNLEDYSTDQRGDVGSWVREESMKCLGLVVPIVTQLERPNLNGMEEVVYISVESHTQIIGKVLKQASERIDRTRVCAGQTLETILQCLCPDEQSLFIIPGQAHLNDIISKHLDWTSPADVYPLLVPLIAVKEYRYEILTGLVTSAGSRSESLLRYSSQYLNEYINQLPAKESGTNDVQLQDVVREFNLILQNYQNVDRVSIALLGVVGGLFENGTLTKVNDDAMLAGFATLSPSKARITALQQLFTYLVHPFPRVRVATADQLFVYLSTLEEDQVNDQTMEAEELLTGTDWMQPVSEIKSTRDELYRLLDIPQPNP